MRITILFIITLTTISVSAQQPDSVAGPERPLIEKDDIILIEEITPEYPGGFEALKKFIDRNLRYPDVKEEGHGFIFVSFMVGEDGMVSDPTVVKGLSKAYDDCALEVVKKMPKWIPAKKDGKAVAAKMVVPVKF